MGVKLVILFYAFCANLYLACAICNYNGYYWREYRFGRIPKDAFIAGQDSNNRNIYIAQVCVSDSLIVGYLQNNFKKVQVPIYGVKTVKNNIKVLCGPQECFKWLKTKASYVKYHVHHISGLHHVIGGFEHHRGTYYIGRKEVDWSLKIGKVNSFDTPSSFYYAENNIQHRNISSYEVLMYKSHSYDYNH